MAADRSASATHVQSASAIRRFVLLSWVALVVAWSPAMAIAAGYDIYDVDFSSPPHTVGAPPLTGSGPLPVATVSSIPLGSPTVESALGSFSDQPLVMNGGLLTGSTWYEQISFDVGLEASAYRIEFGLYVDELAAGSSLSLLIDSPLANQLSFDSDGAIRSTAPGLWTSTVVGSYALDTAISVRLDLSPNDGTWQAYIDELLVQSESWTPIPGDGLMDDIDFVRFNLSEPDGGGGAQSFAGLDDIRISTIPEPGTAVLMALGLVGLTITRRTGRI